MALKTSDFDYELPPELIAQEPLPERDASRMMVIDRQSESIEHRLFSDLPEMLNTGDLLVLNDTRVIPARLFGTRKGTGGKAELLLVEEVGGSDQSSVISDQLSDAKGSTWTALLRSGWKPREGIRLLLADGRIEGVIRSVGEEGKVTVELSAEKPLMEALDERGYTPLPPYIKRHQPSTINHEPFPEDRRRYQTIYAAVPGAVAAPTAGLHFTDEIFSRLAARGVRKATITLHVGPGTFRPVKTESVEEHSMEEERYRVDDETARAINTARNEGGRIVGVGSTSVRTLETVVSEDGAVAAGHGRSSLFIFPPFEFRAVDVMLTNFHLPKSTLIMMVSAFTGIDFLRRAYEEAVREKYRFYSYGDCMLIL